MTSAPRSLPVPITAAGRVALHELAEGLADRLGRVVGQARVVDRVEDGHAGRGESRCHGRCARPPRDGVERHPA